MGWRGLCGMRLLCDEMVEWRVAGVDLCEERYFRSSVDVSMDRSYARNVNAGAS